MPRFALLSHDHPAHHLDLLLQAGDVAWTWRLPAWPGAGDAVPAERIADHRLLYLTYEGEVSGGRGTVARLDGGEYAWVGLAPGRCIVRLEGVRLRGVLDLVEGQGGWVARFTA